MLELHKGGVIGVALPEPSGFLEKVSGSAIYKRGYPRGADTALHPIDKVRREPQFLHD